MNDEWEIQAGFELYKQFIRGGYGSCMEVTVKGKKVRETPEQACVRRWRRLRDTVREGFIAEGRKQQET
ncbi:hypothetical protein DEA98_10240 [Brucella pseudogrignonensis]|uniref:Uncharacterized protein n=1 Tax=Brucella pecoris TaxID=867683 RepID=A0AB34YNK3_9HYPH|nr:MULTISPECIES: hypothetical protein [Brucella]MBB4092400.1 hypothetical protein [Brucella pecoris]MCH4539127.1 hypothetical protein [Ochrobactrum sp. A-1]MCM0751576.1 hypothetical protein [Brucella pseudogrignonensis]NKW80314.1 hypothetical protein [Brucella pecoris]